MKTSSDIPEKELRDVIRFTGAKTKRAAVVTAIMDYNRRRRAGELVKYFGTFDTLLTNEQLEALGGTWAATWPDLPDYRHRGRGVRMASPC